MLTWLMQFFFTGAGASANAGITYAPLGELNRQSVRLDKICRNVKPLEINRDSVSLGELKQ